MIKVMERILTDTGPNRDLVETRSEIELGKVLGRGGLTFCFWMRIRQSKVESEPLPTIVGGAETGPGAASVIS